MDINEAHKIWRDSIKALRSLIESEVLDLDAVQKHHAAMVAARTTLREEGDRENQEMRSKAAERQARQKAERNRVAGFSRVFGFYC